MIAWRLKLKSVPYKSRQNSYVSIGKSKMRKLLSCVYYDILMYILLTCKKCYVYIAFVSCIKQMKYVLSHLYELLSPYKCQIKRKTYYVSSSFFSVYDFDLQANNLAQV